MSNLLCAIIQISQIISLNFNIYQIQIMIKQIRLSALLSILLILFLVPSVTSFYLKNNLYLEGYAKGYIKHKAIECSHCKYTIQANVDIFTIILYSETNPQEVLEQFQLTIHQKNSLYRIRTAQYYVEPVKKYDSNQFYDGNLYFQHFVANGVQFSYKLYLPKSQIILTSKQNPVVINTYAIPIIFSIFAIVSLIIMPIHTKDKAMSVYKLFKPIPQRQNPTQFAQALNFVNLNITIQLLNLITIKGMIITISYIFYASSVIEVISYYIMYTVVIGQILIVYGLLFVSFVRHWSFLNNRSLLARNYSSNSILDYLNYNTFRMFLVSAFMLIFGLGAVPFYLCFFEKSLGFQLLLLLIINFQVAYLIYRIKFDPNSVCLVNGKILAYQIAMISLLTVTQFFIPVLNFQWMDFTLEYVLGLIFFNIVELIVCFIIVSVIFKFLGKVSLTKQVNSMAQMKIEQQMSSNQNASSSTGAQGNVGQNNRKKRHRKISNPSEEI